MKDGVTMPSKKDTTLYIYIPKVEIILCQLPRPTANALEVGACKSSD
jgi:hypothetical protein